MHSRRAEVMAFAALLVAVAALVFALGSGSLLSAQGGTDGTSQVEVQPQDAAAVAAIPATFNYQGILRQADGSLASGSYTLTLRIYDQVAGGTMLHQEPFNNQAVRDGVFNVVLGDAVPIQTNVFADAPRYLGVTVAGDPEMIPRQRLHPVPWALQANTLVAGPTLTGPVNVGSYSSGDQYVKVMTAFTATGNRSGIQLRVFNDNYGFNIENDDRLASKGLNIWRHDGGAPAQALFIERTTGDTTVFSDLKVKAIRDIGNAAGQVNRQTYDQSLRRYLVEAQDGGNSPNTVPVDDSLLVGLCGDLDGCEVTVGMRDWTSQTTGPGLLTTIGPFRFSLAATRPNGQRFWDLRNQYGGSSSFWDGNGAVDHALNAFDSCYFTDGRYQAGAGSDPGLGFGLLNWSGGYTAVDMVCVLIIDD